MFLSLQPQSGTDVLRIAKQIDPDVFMTMAPVMGVFGKGFEEVKGVK